jgi:hypothetical protein
LECHRCAEEEGLGFIEASKRLGEIWKNLTEDEKAPYNAKAKEDQERIANLKSTLAGEAVAQPKRKALPKKEPEDCLGSAQAEGKESTSGQKAASKKRKADKVCHAAWGQNGLHILSV